MDNRSPNLHLQASFTFDLQNLSLLSKTPATKDLSVDLKPGQKHISRFYLLDPLLPWGYKYSYTYRVCELYKNEAELEALIRSKGEVKGFTKGEVVGARYYVHFLNETYYFLFENINTEGGGGESFRGTFSFTMENLRIEGGEGNGFKVELRAGEKVVKRLTRVDNTQKSKYKMSFSYCFIDD